MTTDVDTSARPARLQWLRPAVATWCAFTVLAAIVMLGQHDYLARALIKANAKADKPKANYTGQVVDTDVSRIMNYDIVQSVLISLILALVTFAVLRGRAWARWLLVGLATLLPLVLPVLGIGVVVQLVLGLLTSFPAVYKTLEVLAGLASLAVVVILFLPEVRAYFRGIRTEDRAERAQLYSRAGRSARPASPFGLLSPFKGRRSGPAQFVAGVVPDEAPNSTEVLPPVGSASPHVGGASTLDRSQHSLVAADLPADAPPASRSAGSVQPRRVAPKSREQ